MHWRLLDRRVSRPPSLVFGEVLASGCQRPVTCGNRRRPPPLTQARAKPKAVRCKHRRPSMQPPQSLCGLITHTTPRSSAAPVPVPLRRHQESFLAHHFVLLYVTVPPQIVLLDSHVLASQMGLQRPPKRSAPTWYYLRYLSIMIPVLPQAPSVQNVVVCWCAQALLPVPTQYRHQPSVSR